MTFEYWWIHERNKIAEPAEDRMTKMVYKQCWDAAIEEAAEIALNHICDRSLQYGCDCGEEIAQKIRGTE